ncbi:MAG: TIGR03761 family integrating conjugative element protein, partial [Gammaproteobacteria bacterium]|nr:TIGR03761 family integrating conjugative element protein [Gammaproteobacteria bacterium]
ECMSILSTDTEQQPAQATQETKKPGVLRSQATLTLQTKYGQSFIYGRARNDAKGKKQIPGLLEYARRTRIIWLSVLADDPYADWQLVKIENYLENAKQSIQSSNKDIKDALQSISGMEVQPAQSLSPITVPLNFQNPYAYMGAGIVSEYDQLACRVFSATHVGMIRKKQGFIILNQAGAGIRRVFSAAYEWKYSGVTRKDINNKTKIAEHAIQIMGDCPHVILNKTNRASNAPEITHN